MENQITKINNFPKTKEDIKIWAESLVKGLDSGDINPMDLLQAIKGVEKLHEEIKPLLSKSVLNEVRKYPEKLIDYHGVKFTIKETGTTYSYDNCNDPVYVELKTLADEANENLKKRQKFLQSLTEPFKYLDEGTGELIVIYPAVKTSTTGVQVSFS
jgi:hypothetical protein